MGPTWVLSAPDGPHVGPMNLAIRDNNWGVDILSNATIARLRHHWQPEICLYVLNLVFDITDISLQLILSSCPMDRYGSDILQTQYHYEPWDFQLPIHTIVIIFQENIAKDLLGIIFHDIDWLNFLSDSEWLWCTWSQWSPSDNCVSHRGNGSCK